jgi:aspartate aminotransferase
LVVARINSIEGLSCDPPEGAFYVYVDASDLIGRSDRNGNPMRTDVDIANHLLEVGGVAVVPGTGFGASPYFRLCFAYDDSVIAEACDRIARVVSELGGAR